mmetsp:Transcript_22537/g.56909  ORF Transcript_22537/g.56909 Transcript_22537/m.56909 type:complete len:266 (-) Transcript_22537:662-1459(-)
MPCTFASIAATSSLVFSDVARRSALSVCSANSVILTSASTLNEVSPTRLESCRASSASMAKPLASWAFAMSRATSGAKTLSTIASEASFTILHRCAICDILSESAARSSTSCWEKARVARRSRCRSRTSMPLWRRVRRLPFHMRHQSWMSRAAFSSIENLAASLSSTSRADISLGVHWRACSRAAVRIAARTRPASALMAAQAREKSVVGTRSPYPTVVEVMKVAQTAFHMYRSLTFVKYLTLSMLQSTAFSLRHRGSSGVTPSS